MFMDEAYLGETVASARDHPFTFDIAEDGRYCFLPKTWARACVRLQIAQLWFAECAGSAGGGCGCIPSGAFPFSGCEKDVHARINVLHNLRHGFL